MWGVLLHSPELEREAPTDQQSILAVGKVAPDLFDDVTLEVLVDGEPECESIWLRVLREQIHLASLVEAGLLSKTRCLMERITVDH